MTGHVFHPGHEEFHGVTVVVESLGGLTYVGRYHEQNDRGVVLHDVAVHDPGASTQTRAAWLLRLGKFGIPIDRRSAIVPVTEAVSVVRLNEVLQALE